MKDKEVNIHLLYEYVRYLQSSKRKGTACTKTRGEVSGTGRKPWAQKHTGRARAGSIRSPLWRGGGIIFGPRPRNFKIKIPALKKEKALLSAIFAKKDSIVVIDNLVIKDYDTKSAYEFINKLNPAKKNLIVDENITDGIKKSFANLKNVTLKDIKQLNAYDILLHDKIFFTKKVEDFFKDKENV